MIKIPCVLLAGGKSSRMGKNKALLPFGGCKTLAEHQYKRLKMIFETVYISCKEPSLFDFEADFIVDESREFASIFGLCYAFKKLNSSEIFFLPIDTPFFDTESINRLFGSYKNSSVIAKSGDKTHNLIAIYTREITPLLKQKIDKSDYRISTILNSVRHEFVEFDEESCANINTKEDYAKAILMSPNCAPKPL